jgi:hypothetical protein
MNRPVAASHAALLVALLTAVSACAVRQSPRAAPATSGSRLAPSSVQGLHFERAEAPPRQIPTVNLSSSTGLPIGQGELLFYDWIVGGRFVERVPGKRVRWPAVVTVKGSGWLTFAANTDRLPIRGELRFYRGLGPTGAPVGEPAVYRCARGGPQGTRAGACLMQRQRAGRTARLLLRGAPDLQPGVYAVVLYLSWHVPNARKPGAAPLPFAVGASWGFRVSVGGGG